MGLLPELSFFDGRSNKLRALSTAVVQIHGLLAIVIIAFVPSATLAYLMFAWFSAGSWPARGVLVGVSLLLISGGTLGATGLMVRQSIRKHLRRLLLERSLCPACGCILESPQTPKCEQCGAGESIRSLPADSFLVRCLPWLAMLISLVYLCYIIPHSPWRETGKMKYVFAVGFACIVGWWGCVRAGLIENEDEGGSKHRTHGPNPQAKDR